jgi:hypothetical protein
MSSEPLPPAKCVEPAGIVSGRRLVRHVAAVPTDGQQRCLRCASVICAGPAFFVAGEIVVQETGENILLDCRLSERNHGTPKTSNENLESPNTTPEAT